MIGEAASLLIEIVLWGAPGAGKTSGLAALFGANPPRWLALGDPQTAATVDRFQETWGQLQSSQLVAGTLRAETFTVRMVSGQEVRFRDMKGGHSLGNAQHPEDAAALRAAGGVLCFYEWPTETERHSQLALGTIRAALGPFDAPDLQTPVLLVITKCEAWLAPQELAAFARDPHGWVEAHKEHLPRPLVDTVRRFPVGAVFPTTTYGYGDATKRPAHTPDEFARLVPWGISPWGIERPFDRVLLGAG